MRRGGALAAAAGGLLALSALPCAAPAAAQPSDLAVKAAFLPKFGSYVTWPSRRGGGPLTLCVIGSDPFGRMIDAAIAREQNAGRPVRLRRIEGPDGADGCHVAFVQGSAGRGTAAMLQGLSRKPVLTVTDERGGTSRGMIHFVVQEGRVRFHIDQAAVAEAGLAMNSRLLALALSVRGRR